MRRWVVTGTDTGVGKTVTTACLAAAARARGDRVLALKPVASGVPHGTFGDDAETLGAAAGHPPELALGLEAPLSPHRAAAIAGVRVDAAAIAAWIAAKVADTVLIEGVGGWRCPIDLRVQLRDLIGPWPVIVVAADRLGTLNHTCLTVDAVRADGFVVAGVVLVEGSDLSSSYNADDLRALLDVPIVRLPRLARPGADAGRALWDALAAGSW